ncbi:MAG: division/cell wall cluster transcriptional repressor MraZ [Candidatus Marinimicrobia bacterium]|nr:division/cell wall cluster transcriptional repressor MraZ [Candidatus Neomarinimicrobiota bacterium]
MEQEQYSFSGSFSYIIDQKNRLNIPAKFRKELGPKNDNTFVITKGFDSCLYVYPATEWNRVQSELMSLNLIKEKNRNFIRSILRFTTHVKFDRQGRVQIPENLLAYAGIKKEVEIIGFGTKLEIWNPKKLEELDEQSYDGDEFEDLANDISF